MMNKMASFAKKRDINVTPLIDVMLVLLIIFMIVTPLSHAGLDVELPMSAADVDAPPPPTEVLVLTMDADGAIAINKKRIDKEELPSRIRDIFETRADRTLFLRADAALRYREVVTVLDILRGNGIERVGIVRD